jgi:thiol-disulfide isomerase/thioredoxin
METPMLPDDMHDIDMLLAGRTPVVLLDCYALGCAPCAALGGALDELVRDLQGQLVVEKIDVSARPADARQPFRPVHPRHAASLNPTAAK